MHATSLLYRSKHDTSRETRFSHCLNNGGKPIEIYETYVFVYKQKVEVNEVYKKYIYIYINRKKWNKRVVCCARRQWRTAAFAKNVRSRFSYIRPLFPYIQFVRIYISYIYNRSIVRAIYIRAWSCIFRNWSRLGLKMYIFLTLEFTLN